MGQVGHVSVIIPSYNHASFLLRAVNSVLAQSYDDIELIVIDDGSSDSSLEVLSKIKDKRLKIFDQENQGAHATINRGMTLASGDYIAILNSDDAYHPERIAKALDFFAGNPEVGLVTTWIEIVDKCEKTIGVKQGWMNSLPWHLPEIEKLISPPDSYELSLIVSNFVSTTSNIVMRKGVWQTCGPMKALKYAHDWDFLLRAASSRKCAEIKEPLLKYRVHETNTIRSNRKEMILEILWVWACHLSRYEDELLKEWTRRGHPERYCIETLYNSINCHGQDRLFWAMRSFMETMKRSDLCMHEDNLLNTETKNKLLSLITLSDGVAESRKKKVSLRALAKLGWRLISGNARIESD